MSIKIDKIYSELSKGNPEEQYEAYLLVKDFVQKSLSAQQKEVEEKANELQNKIERLSGTNY
jgi:TolA-binding protein